MRMFKIIFLIMSLLLSGITYAELVQAPEYKDALVATPCKVMCANDEHKARCEKTCDASVAQAHDEQSLEANAG
jgi:hypothetical protein